MALHSVVAPLALYVALVYLIHGWPLLEKMRKTLSVAILVAMKVLVDNVCACEKRDLVKPRFKLETCLDFLEMQSELFRKQLL